MIRFFISIISAFTCSFAVTQITTLPFYCDQAGETYELASDFSTSANPAIGIEAENVIIDGRGHTITYTGEGITQKIIRVNGGRGSFEVKNTSFLLTGSSRLTVADGASKFNNNTIIAYNLTPAPDNSYPRLLFPRDNSEIYNNRIYIDSMCVYVNVFAGWGAENVKVYNNIVRIASDHCRVFIIDSACRFWDVYNNHVTCTSQCTADHTAYICMVRDGAGSTESTDHHIHHNTFNGSGSNNSKGIILSSGTKRCRVHNNIVLATNGVMKINGSGNRDNDIFCNEFTHTENGPALLFYNADISGITISNNTCNGILSCSANLTGSGAVTLCGNEGVVPPTTSAVSDPSDFTFLEGSCQNADGECGDEVGADTLGCGEIGNIHPTMVFTSQDLVSSKSFSLQATTIKNGVRFQIQGVIGTCFLQVYNAKGQMIWSAAMSDAVLKNSVVPLSQTGSYFVRITSNGRENVERFVFMR